MPVLAPIISADTTRIRAIEALMRKPDRIEGSMAGNTTLRIMAANGTSKLCAMRMRLRCTLSTPA